MAKYKPYNYSQTVMLPISLDDQLTPGTIEFAIHTLVEERMDVSRFDEQYSNDETGCKAYNPKILLKVILLAYSRGIIHSRKIERECKRNVTFMALSCGQEPDHSTIADFRKNFLEEIKELFVQVLLIAQELGVFKLGNISLDGSKIRADASKHKAVSYKRLLELEEQLQAEVEALFVLAQETEEAERPEGLVIAAGMSGHGFGLGPMAGRLAAELARDGKASHDLTAFRAGRFSQRKSL